MRKTWMFWLLLFAIILIFGFGMIGCGQRGDPELEAQASGGGGIPPVPPPVGDITPPTIIGIMPASGAVNVPVSTTAEMVASEQLSATSVNAFSVWVEEEISEARVITNPPALNSNRVFVSPANAWLYNTTYIIRASGLQDLAGNSLPVPFSATFTTLANQYSDTTPPYIQGSSPANGAMYVATTVIIRMTSSEALDLFSINSLNVILNSPSGTPVPASVLLSGNDIVVRPDQPLLNNTPGAGPYQVYVIGVTDLAGNPMASYTMSFWTVDAPVGDTTPPTIIGIMPASGAVNVPVSTTAEMVASEQLSATSVNAFSVWVEEEISEARVITNPPALNSNRVFVSPANAWLYNTTYIIRASGLQDLAGNSLPVPFSATFTTLANQYSDTTLPYIQGSSPANGAMYVATTVIIRMTSSEALDLFSINSLNVILNSPSGTPVPASVLLSGNDIVVRPDQPLLYNTPGAGPYRVYVIGATDLAGNPMAPYTMSFWTVDAPVDLPPSLLRISSAGSFNVPLNAPIQFFFSEWVSFSSVANSIGFASDLSGSWTVDSSGSVYTFTPVNAEYATAYTIQVADTITDATGNRLVSAITANFTTEADGSLDMTAPSISITPSGSGIQAGTPIQILATECLDWPSLLNAVTFTPGLTGSWSGSCNIFTYAPTNLLPLTTYTIDVAPSASDLAGNNLPALVTATFTTAADGTIDVTPPTLVSFSPSGTGVPLDAPIQMIFGKIVDCPSVVNAVSVSPTLYGSWSCGGPVITYTPVGVANATTYVVAADASVMDMAGNRIASGFSWSYTTAVGTTTTTTTTTSLFNAPSFGPSGAVVNGTTVVQYCFGEGASYLLNISYQSPGVGAVGMVIGNSISYTPVGAGIVNTSCATGDGLNWSASTEASVGVYSLGATTGTLPVASARFIVNAPAVATFSNATGAVDKTVDDPVIRWDAQLKYDGLSFTAGVGLSIAFACSSVNGSEVVVIGQDTTAGWIHLWEKTAKCNGGIIVLNVIPSSTDPTGTIAVLVDEVDSYVFGDITATVLQ